MHQDLGQKEMPVRPGKEDELHPKAVRTWKGFPSRAPGRGTASGRGRRAPRPAAAGRARGRARPTRRKGSGSRGFAPTMFGRRASAPRRPERCRRARAGYSRPQPAAIPGPSGDADPQACHQDPARSPEAPRPHLARSVAEAGQAQRARPARGACGDPEAPGARPRPGQMTPRCGVLSGRVAKAPRAPGQVR